MRTYAKAIVAMLGAVALVVQEVAVDGLSQGDVFAILIAVITAAGVYLVPNLPE